MQSGAAQKGRGGGLGTGKMEVLLHPKAAKYLERLPEPGEEKIKEALRGLSKEPREGDIKPMVGEKGKWRMRAGNHRVLFKIEEDIVFVTHIDLRGQVYKKKNRER
jgi:mRNA interferase RelE/StbE